MATSSRGKHHPNNELNDLTGSEWLAFTRTWFEQAAADPELPDELVEVLRRYAAALQEQAAAGDLNDLTPAEWLDDAQSWFVADSRRYWKNKPTELHPARFPEEMVERFVRFFTKRDQWVLDPFAGSGATLVSCQEASRNGVGIELNPTYAETVRRRTAVLADVKTLVLQADARRADQPGLWQPALAAGCPSENGLPQFDFMLTSPPYWNMLRTSRGGVQSTHKDRAAQGLATHYSESDSDLGNLTDYDAFLEGLGGIFDKLHPLLRPGRYLVVVVQNLREPSGEVCTLAWDLARRLSRTYQLQGEKVWCQNTKKLGIWGYPKLFVPNYHHHYCLIFRRRPV